MYTVYYHILYMYMYMYMYMHTDWPELNLPVGPKIANAITCTQFRAKSSAYVSEVKLCWNKGRVTTDLYILKNIHV